MTEKWGTRRGFIKLHVGVDARTKKIYAVVITDDKCGDSPQFEEPAEPAEQAFANAEKSSSVNTPADPMIAADGAYDTRKIRRYCSEKGIARRSRSALIFPAIPADARPARRQDSCSLEVLIT